VFERYAADKITAGAREEQYQASRHRVDDSIVFCHPALGTPLDPSKLTTYARKALNRGERARVVPSLARPPTHRVDGNRGGGRSGDVRAGERGTRARLDDGAVPARPQDPISGRGGAGGGAVVRMDSGATLTMQTRRLYRGWPQLTSCGGVSDAMGREAMRKTSLLLVALCAAVLAGVGATSAFAGEATGNFERTGKQTPIGAAPDDAPHAASICSFSGQNPEQFLDESDPDFEPGRTQSWGQIPKEIRDILATQGEQPGDSCNGHTGFFAGGGGE
jgi:hypothetical protein